MLHCPKTLLQSRQESHACWEHSLQCSCTRSRAGGGNQLWFSLGAFSCTAGIISTAQGTNKMILYSTRVKVAFYSVWVKLYEDVRRASKVHKTPNPARPLLLHVRKWPISVHLPPIATFPAGACWALTNIVIEQQLCWSVFVSPSTMPQPQVTIDMSSLVIGMGKHGNPVHCSSNGRFFSLWHILCHLQNSIKGMKRAVSP